MNNNNHNRFGSEQKLNSKKSISVIYHPQRSVKFGIFMDVNDRMNYAVREDPCGEILMEATGIN